MTIATLLLVFLLTDLSGSEKVHIMRKISVQKGQTIIIPCLYDANLVNFSKYMSHGPYFLFSRVRHDRLSILDYKKEKFFTAILRNAELDDTGSYWCAVELSGPDLATKVLLEVTEEKDISKNACKTPLTMLGKTKPYVSNQNVTGYEGKNIIIHCYGASKWCKIGGSCAEEKRGTFDKSKVDISGDDKVLKVTLKALHRNDAGWYFCCDGKSQMPVYVTTSLYSNYTSVRLEKSRDHRKFRWLVVLGPIGLLSIIICGVVICRIFHKRKQRTAVLNIYESMNGKHLSQERNHANIHENAYEVMSIGVHSIKQTVKDEKDTYATVMKHSTSSDPH